MPSSKASVSGRTTPVDRDAVTFHLTKRELLALQIQALVDAAEDVDLSPEVAEELFSCMPSEEAEDEDTPGDISPQLDSKKPPPDSQDADDEEGVDIVATNGEVDLWSIVDPFDKATDSWTRQEVRQIRFHLKERGVTSFITEYVDKRDIPITKLLNAFGFDLSAVLLEKSHKTLMYLLNVAMSFQLSKREKLPQYNTISDAVQLIRNAQRILILTGAGISVSCGIPDFRSRNGLYATLKESGEYDLDDPQQMFDLGYFRENPAVFYSFARQIYPSNFVPSPCHRFLKAVEDHGKLLRNYTQNIDTLESMVGVDRVLQCHGSFASASCLACRRQVPGVDIEQEILAQKVPICKACPTPPPPPPPVKKKKLKKGQKAWEQSDSEEDVPPPPAYPPYLMKPDITFFGEKLNDNFDRSLAEDRDKVDLLLVIGTSLKVSPVADMISHLPHSIPQILINKTPVTHINPDIVLLGNADDIILHLCDELGWELPPPVPQPSSGERPQTLRSRGSLKRRFSSDSTQAGKPKRVGNSHVWLFEGAEGGKWLEVVKEQYAGMEQSGASRSQSSSRRQSPSTSEGKSTDERPLKKAKGRLAENQKSEERTSRKVDDHISRHDANFALK
ncbi:SIR2-domain-containing protein [Coprinopsis marcescibilis]|uniref:SIR2-domain-containing protein n=1 Tax=Coprinopsis marcescibilis TaxID=230819 RepID=A0A5C3KD15_COPMA|nr:SIR2-domain-containing protein [Coprinopsis marcescibilis]